jgi:hypothetical protein
VVKLVVHRDISNLRKDSFCKFVFIAFAITSDDSIVPDFNIFTSQILNTNDRDNESMDSVYGKHD